MYVKIGPYVNWFGPYQVADKIFFWVDNYPELKDPTGKLEERWDYKAKDWLGEFLAHGFEKEKPENDVFRRRRRERHHTWFYKLLSWIHSKQKRTMIIKLDRWDSWNVDGTLSPIILPLLKQLKSHKHGSGMVDLEDVPEHLRYTQTEDYDSQLVFDFYEKEDTSKLNVDVHVRWDWVLDEMIWTFEQLQPDYDWEDQYSTGEIDWLSVPCEWHENGKPKLFRMEEGPEHTYKTDWTAREKHQERINNGLRLFGKYYQNLWD
jgi:hypothetical protein